MFKHIINIFRVNVLLKVISIGIAFLLWFVVVNVSNPEVTDSVTMEIEVNYGDELINAGKSFSLDSKTVRVSYNVRTSYRSQIQPSSFKAYVDMRDYSVTGAVPVYVDTDPSVVSLISGVRQTPMVIHVSTEDMQEKSFPVTVRLDGEPTDGFVVGEVILEPESVKLYGPESEIGKISRVGITVDISGVSETQSGTGKVQFLDANDNTTQLSSNVSVSGNVNYTIPVYRTKSLSINVPTTGQPAHGYTLTGVETEPRFVQVYGEDDVLEQYNTIYLPEGLLDISGVNSNVTISVAIQNYLPEGLYLVQQSDASIVARIARQTDLIPGAAGLPAATIQAPPQTEPVLPTEPAVTVIGPDDHEVVETTTAEDIIEIPEYETTVSEYPEEPVSLAETPADETNDSDGVQETHSDPEDHVMHESSEAGELTEGPADYVEHEQTTYEPVPYEQGPAEEDNGQVISPAE